MSGSYFPIQKVGEVEFLKFKFGKYKAGTEGVGQ